MKESRGRVVISETNWKNLGSFWCFLHEFGESLLIFWEILKKSWGSLVFFLREFEGISGVSPWCLLNEFERISGAVSGFLRQFKNFGAPSVFFFWKNLKDSRESPFFFLLFSKKVEKISWVVFWKNLKEFRAPQVF